MNKASKLLIFLSAIMIVIGVGMFWFGQKESSEDKNANVSEIPEIEKASPEPAPKENTFGQTFGIDGERVYVAEVVDGDTIKIDTGETVRLIGIDTPETVDPRRPVGCFGKEASKEAKSLLSGKEVILQKDISETDKYRRLLRYVYLPLEDGKLLFVNDYLIREGFAVVLTYPPDVKFNEQFREAEREAKEDIRGLWGKC